MKHILVVDDNPSSRELVKFALELEADYEIEEAADGHDAISRIRHVRPDLILMDIQMPEMDGYETLRQIRAHPACKLVPVVAITAFAMLDDGKRRSKRVSTDTLPNPSTSRLFERKSTHYFENERTTGITDRG